MEAQEKIAQIYRIFHKGREPHPSFASEILKQLGYRKPGELLTTEKIMSILDTTFGAYDDGKAKSPISYLSIIELLQAQLDNGGG